MHELIEGLRAFERLKQAVSATPVLRYYNLKEYVTFQCDASQCALVRRYYKVGSLWHMRRTR